MPIYTTAKVHRDHHIEVAKALYSVPGNLIGQRVEVRADRSLVRVFARGQLVKMRPRQQPGRRVTDPDDLPSERTVYAMRDLEHLRRLAATHGPAVGTFAAALLEHPLPWTKMRQVYALLGLVKKWGAERVDAACASALDHEAVNVGLIGRMLERGTENTTAQQRCRASSWRVASPAIPATSPPAQPPAARDDRTHGHPRTQGPAPSSEARPLPRHAARTARTRAHPRVGASGARSERNSCFLILPEGVRGRSVTMWILRGHLCFATPNVSSRRLMASSWGGGAGGCIVTNAATCSPKGSSGAPSAATSATPSIAVRARRRFERWSVGSSANATW